MSKILLDLLGFIGTLIAIVGLVLVGYYGFYFLFDIYLNYPSQTCILVLGQMILSMMLFLISFLFAY
jgi:hypothetical protein